MRDSTQRRRDTEKHRAFIFWRSTEENRGLNVVRRRFRGVLKETKIERFNTVLGG